MSRQPRKIVAISVSSSVSLIKLVSHFVTMLCATASTVFKSGTATLALGCVTAVSVFKIALKIVQTALATFAEWILRYWQQRPEQPESWTQAAMQSETWTENSKIAEPWSDKSTPSTSWIERPKSDEPWS